MQNWDLLGQVKEHGVTKKLRQAGRWAAEHRFVKTLAAKKWSILLVAMAFLLGKAVILEKFAPFALAYFAVIYFLRNDLLYWVGLSLLTGSFFSGFAYSPYIAAELLFFLLMVKGLEKYARSEISYAPLIVFISMFFVQFSAHTLVQELTWYAITIILVEAVLSFVLTLIFVQAIPVFTLSKKNYHLKHEEMICLMILLASVMTGMTGWVWQDVSLEHVMSRYLILLFALVGGAPLGATVGVITGMILSLADVHAVYQMSLLAFSGMLAGLLKEGRKLSVAVGMLLGSAILSIYIPSGEAWILSVWESLAAVLLFMLTPRGVIQMVAKYVPGTRENMKTHYDYAKRVRDMIAGRVEQFSDVFRQLASSFSQAGQAEQEERRDQEISHFMNSVSEHTCATCWKNKKCWEQQFYQTYKFMTEMMTEIEANPELAANGIRKEWKQVCVKTQHVLKIMKQQYRLYEHNLHWRRHIQESRQLVAEQLSGVSRVMEDLAREIKREGQELVSQEEQIRHALEELGLSIYSIDIISLDEGSVEIEMVHQYNQGMDECRKIVAPLLSDILGENIAVKKEELTDRENGYYLVTFGSAKEYEVSTGIAAMAKGGNVLSGDSFSTMEFGNGKFAVAISDGMGNGERANMESRTALSILQQLLQSGMEERLAVKAVNSILLLRSPEEMYATIDVALIDLYSANTTFMKIGSTPSFIKRGDEVMQISACNLPVGILHDIDVDLVNMQLKPGDTIIMMTDGIYDAPGPAVNKELWIKRMIQEIDEEDPQQFADMLLDRIVRYHHGEIMDDMTVAVAKIETYKPEWTTFRWPGLTHIERPKTVS